MAVTEKKVMGFFFLGHKGLIKSKALNFLAGSPQKTNPKGHQDQKPINSVGTQPLLLLAKTKSESTDTAAQGRM